MKYYKMNYCRKCKIEIPKGANRLFCKECLAELDKEIEDYINIKGPTMEQIQEKRKMLRRKLEKKNRDELIEIIIDLEIDNYY